MRADEHCLGLSDAIRTILGGSGRERDVALYRVAEDVLATLGEFYAPSRAAPVVPEPLRGISSESLRERVREPAIAFMFGTFRNLVLEHEENAARKLEVLRSTARTLLRLRDGAHAPEKLDGMVHALGSFVLSAWGKDLDLSADRAWSLRVSRRYDLLPTAWREL